MKLIIIEWEHIQKIMWFHILLATQASGNSKLCSITMLWKSLSHGLTLTFTTSSIVAIDVDIVAV